MTVPTSALQDAQHKPDDSEPPNSGICKQPRKIMLSDFIKAPINKAPRKNISLLTSAESINSIGAARGEKAKIKITADSGAAASVLPSHLLREQVGTRAGENEGMLYAAAGPTSKPIRNVGQRVLRGLTEHGNKLQLPFEAVDNITKPLASVSKMVDANKTVIYHPSGSAIFDLGDEHNKELKTILQRAVTNSKYSKVPLNRENDVYNFELLVDLPASKKANEPDSASPAGFAGQRN